MWLGIWAGRRRGEPRFVQLQERYAEFRAEDVALLHDDHHAEIHSIYDQIINADKKRLGISLYDYTWRQAEALMDKLEAAFNEWVGRETPGISARDYARVKAKQRNHNQRLMEEASLRRQKKLAEAMCAAAKKSS